MEKLTNQMASILDEFHHLKGENTKVQLELNVVKQGQRNILHHQQESELRHQTTDGHLQEVKETTIHLSQQYHTMRRDHLELKHDQQDLWSHQKNLEQRFEQDQDQDREVQEIAIAHQQSSLPSNSLSPASAPSPLPSSSSAALSRSSSSSSNFASPSLKRSNGNRVSLQRTPKKSKAYNALDMLE